MATATLIAPAPETDGAERFECTEHGCPTPIRHDDDHWECQECRDAFCLAGDHNQYGQDGDFCFSCWEDLYCACNGCGSDLHIENVWWCESCQACQCKHCWGDGVGKYCEYHSEDSCDTRSGNILVAPWEARNQIVVCPHTVLDWQEAWPIDRTLSPERAAAEFYVLFMMQHPDIFGGRQVGGPELEAYAAIAKERRDQLVATYDQAFCNYVDMVIGGEVRYHQTVQQHGKYLRGSRAAAWADWKDIRNQLGPQALLDAAALFLDMGDGSVGGKPWARAAELLHSRTVGKMTPEQWVDRVFSLEHNGGCMLNKIQWAGPPHLRFSSAEEVCTNFANAEWGYSIKNHIGPAHSNDPPLFPVLLTWCGSDVRKLFASWWIALNRARLNVLLPQLPQPRPICLDQLHFLRIYDFLSQALDANPNMTNAWRYGLMRHVVGYNHSSWNVVPIASTLFRMLERPTDPDAIRWFTATFARIVGRGDECLPYSWGSTVNFATTLTRFRHQPEMKQRIPDWIEWFLVHYLKAGRDFTSRDQYALTNHMGYPGFLVPDGPLELPECSAPPEEAGVASPASVFDGLAKFYAKAPTPK